MNGAPPTQRAFDAKESPKAFPSGVRQEFLVELFEDWRVGEPSAPVHEVSKVVKPRGGRYMLPSRLESFAGTPSTCWQTAPNRQDFSMRAQSSAWLEPEVSPPQEPRPDRALSLGALYHDQGTCIPCKFYFSKKGCKYGAKCVLCHVSHQDLTYSYMRRVMRKNGKMARADAQAVDLPVPSTRVEEVHVQELAVAVVLPMTSGGSRPGLNDHAHATNAELQCPPSSSSKKRSKWGQNQEALSSFTQYLKARYEL